MPHHGDYDYHYKDHGDYGDYMPHHDYHYEYSMPHYDYDYEYSMPQEPPSSGGCVCSMTQGEDCTAAAIKGGGQCGPTDHCMDMPDPKACSPWHGCMWQETPWLEEHCKAPDAGGDYGDESRLAMPGDKKKQPSPRLAVKRRAE